MNKKYKWLIGIVILFFVFEAGGYLIAKKWSNKLPGIKIAEDFNRKWQLGGNHQLTKTGEFWWNIYHNVGKIFAQSKIEEQKWWQTERVWWWMWQPIISGFFLTIIIKKDKRILILAGIILIILINRDEIKNFSDDRWQDTGLNIKTYWSKEYEWMWVSNEDKPVPYSEFIYKININEKTKKALIKIGSLGRYQLLINSKSIYWGPMFGVKKLIYIDEIDIDKYLVKGDNEIKIIVNFIDIPIHSYGYYERPGLLIGGYIQNGLLTYDLANYRFWKGGQKIGWQNNSKLMDSGYSENFDFTIKTNLEKVKTIDRDFSVNKRTVPLLEFNNIKLNKVGNNWEIGQFLPGYILWKSNFENECLVKVKWGIEIKNSEVQNYFDQNDEWQVPSGTFEFTQFNRRGASLISVDTNKCIGKYNIELVVPKSKITLKESKNEIINISNRTLQNNIQDQFEDCVDRERAMYVGDVLADSKCLINQSNNWQYIRQSIITFGLGQNDNGSIPSMVPSGRKQLIPTYSLMWPILMELYVKNSKDLNIILENKDRLNKLMTWAESNENEYGFLINKNNEGWWMFTDWTEGEYNKYQFNTTLQIWYMRMLESMEYLDSQNAEKYKNKKILLINNLRKYAWNNKYNIWVDSFDLVNQSNGGIIINSLAGKFDLFTTREIEERTWKYFTNKLTKTAYSETWVADWGIKLGKNIGVANIIEKYWGGMIQKGATSWWEIFDPITGKMEGSASHSWGCGPSYLYQIVENKNIYLIRF